MTYGEALRLVERLLRDPSSHVAASVGEWSHATTREAIVLMDLYDLTHHIAWKQGGGKGSKPKPYPRPWPSRTKRVTKPSLTQDEVFAALRDAGHTMPLPPV